MSKMKLCALCVLLWQFVVPALALDTLALLGTGPSKTLLQDKKPIVAEAKGSVPVNFDAALHVLRHPDFITHVQDAYCELIDEDGTPEFTIQKTSTNTYFYVNRKDERTDITEVVRRETVEGCFDIILYSAGKRFFGAYQALIHIQVLKEGENNSTYVASVYAYPENAFNRFFARHLGVVERYFKKKTGHMSEIVTTITSSLCEEEVQPALRAGFQQGLPAGEAGS
ncbi:hypothetical protein PDESU_00238 [Pontiella desulfatans]|uniref:DUF4468 domain-containing protein n=1 Tax=Pontiella desulfatans TaxID=2750659 RepID=A0A6C2TVX4_PONDE|nr:hypothetical protein [Pontiella desulfatans]VGO11692.1 hypothetical protein PDESU_00238 [Pontiella desulfatans]